MRKILLLGLITLFLILAACGQQTTDNQPDQMQNEQNQQTNPQDNQPTQDQPETNEQNEQGPNSQTNTQDDQQNQNVKEVTMTAKQFTFEPSTVKVQKGQTLRLEVTSTDVAHGIAIPQFGIDKRLPVGETVTIEFTPDKTGTFDFICSVYCGSGHSSMTGKLIVE